MNLIARSTSLRQPDSQSWHPLAEDTTDLPVTAARAIDNDFGVQADRKRDRAIHRSIARCDSTLLGFARQSVIDFDVVLAAFQALA